MDKIFTLSISCIAGAYLSQAYRFELALAAESTLDELASYILDVIDFEGDHLSTFHLANSPGGRRTWLTARGAWDEDDEEARDLRLCDLYPLEKHKKLYYDYDPGAGWWDGVSKSSGKAGPRTPWPGRIIPACCSSATLVERNVYERVQL